MSTSTEGLACRTLEKFTHTVQQILEARVSFVVERMHDTLLVCMWILEPCFKLDLYMLCDKQVGRRLLILCLGVEVSTRYQVQFQSSPPSNAIAVTTLPQKQHHAMQENSIADPVSPPSSPLWSPRIVRAQRARRSERVAWTLSSSLALPGAAQRSHRLLHRHSLPPILLKYKQPVPHLHSRPSLACLAPIAPFWCLGLSSNA